MEIINIIQGLILIHRSKPEDESKYCVRAEHDELYVGDVEWMDSEGDIKVMEELGWSQKEGSWYTLV